ncbi:MAG: diacylglycerol kinase family protein [Bacteroidota bacterium]
MKAENDSYLKGRQKSFAAAFKGISPLIKEANFRIHLCIACLCLIAASILHFTKVEWLILLLCIFFIFALEAMNTAIEYLVDFVSPEFNHQAGKVKDIASAAVLIGALGVSIIGILLFGPKVWMHFGF